MTDFEKKLNRLRLPSWMNGAELAKMLGIARQFWRVIWAAITWPMRQFDPLTCNPSLLALLGWQRDIIGYNGEPEDLFRKRVAYAFINARDAGTVAGFIAIFDRLGIGYVELRERQPGIDWDIITVRVTDSQIAANKELLMLIIQQYGRSCRRYRFEVITSTKIAINAGWYGAKYNVYTARLVSDTINSATGR